MKLSDIGEFALIERFAQTLPPLHAPGAVGIGDDCAVIPQADGSALVVTTDLLVEGVHFLLSTTSAEDLGFKALAVNLSDVAAMGARPRSVFLSLALPATTSVEWLDSFFAGFRGLAERFGVDILGGDTSRSPDGITISVTALGTAPLSHIKRRSAARAGDVICVTRTLGDSAAGLRILSGSSQAESRELVARHVRPEPSVNEGAWLGEQAGVHAMMDLSDGLASDSQRMTKASNVGAQIDVDKLPISAALRAFAKQEDAVELALTGGEDYGLLLTVSATEFAMLAKQFEEKFLRSLVAVGEIMPGSELQYRFNGEPYVIASKGYSHF